jgi:hypothetical protein
LPKAAPHRSRGALLSIAPNTGARSSGAKLINPSISAVASPVAAPHHARLHIRQAGAQDRRRSVEDRPMYSRRLSSFAISLRRAHSPILLSSIQTCTGLSNIGRSPAALPLTVGPRGLARSCERPVSAHRGRCPFGALQLILEDWLLPVQSSAATNRPNTDRMGPSDRSRRTDEDTR